MIGFDDDGARAHPEPRPGPWRLRHTAHRPHRKDLLLVNLTQTDAVRATYRMARPGPLATIKGTVRDVLSRRRIYELNPFAAIFESYRNLIYYGQAPTWNLLGLVVVESLVILVVGVLVFRRIEPAFAKVL